MFYFTILPSVEFSFSFVLILCVGVGRSFLGFFVDSLKGVRCLEVLFNKIAISSHKNSC